VGGAAFHKRRQELRQELSLAPFVMVKVALDREAVVVDQTPNRPEGQILDTTGQHRADAIDRGGDRVDPTHCIVLVRHHSAARVGECD